MNKDTDTDMDEDTDMDKDTDMNINKDMHCYPIPKYIFPEMH
jgi:hypothetical protein